MVTALQSSLPCLFLLKALPSYLIWFVFFLLNKADFSAFIGRYWIHAEDIKELERKCFSFTILFLNYFMQLLYIFKYENLYKS